MTNDIAVVHWTEGTIEKSARAYTLQMLSQLVETMEKKGVVYIVCLTKLNTIIPVSHRKPATAFKPPTEYVDRVEVTKWHHRAFAEAEGCNELYYRATPEQVKKAYLHNI